MSVVDASADLGEKVIGRHGGQIERSLFRPGDGCAASSEAERPVVLDTEGVRDGEHGRGLGRLGLPAPVVERGAAHLAVFGEPGLGLALPVQGRFDQVEERERGGVGGRFVSHISMCTEMARPGWSFPLPTCGKTWLWLARVGKFTKGIGDVYLSPTQACGRLNISPPTLLKRIRSGEITAIKLGETRNAPVKVLLTSIEAYEERNQMASARNAA